ncbi:MAG TPA: phospho-sugar mutase [Sphaerochaeta sp.]|nr:phospho-sugar mutase [Sphaerochaeta sp.]HQB90528.1 phospho-sugar mutase [Sphaerochaeta sp.]
MAYNEKDLRSKAEAYLAAEQNDVFKAEVEAELAAQDWEALFDRFYTSLAFGTAGMRGIIGGGTNRMNSYMVSKVTQGLADYLNTASENPSVVISYDSRNYSDLFAMQAALVLAANGVSVFLYSTLHPVPMLSFAVRYLQTTAGIVITASHNPAAYNGYKVYWRDGGQVTPPHDFSIAERANGVKAKDIKVISEESARSKGLLVPVPDKVDEAYYHAALLTLRRPSLVQDSPITVVYTPLHGSGNVPVQHLMHKLGITTHVVAEQQEPDGNFPTVPLPNPEHPGAMQLALNLAREVKADIVLGTDPDADRLGIAIPTDGEKRDYMLLTGNQIAVLLVDYLITADAEKQQEKRPLVVKSLVTTDLVAKITERNGGRCKDVLTGFKYIAEQMAELEGPKGESEYFLFGCEESFGYLAMPSVRDKDAISSALVAVEMMSWWAKHGMSLQDRLNQIYREYGYHTELVISEEYEGARGKEKMARIMASLRALKVGDELAGSTIAQMEDLLDGSQSHFPASDVIIMHLANGEKVVVRPSGTEPKIKYYLFFKSEGESRAEFEQKIAGRIAAYKVAFA